MASELDLELQSHDHSGDSTSGTSEMRVLELTPGDYLGGIAIWGALPAVLNTSNLPEEPKGVHVHARRMPGESKEIDETFRLVKIKMLDDNGQKIEFDIDGDEAASYNISTILGIKLKWLRCPDCHKLHTDKGQDSVNYHVKHICEYCGAAFSDSEPSVSNAIMFLKEAFGDAQQNRKIIDPVERKLEPKRGTFKGGMQVWGSNPAILWTAKKPEEGGIHFHGFQDNTELTVDNTYGHLSIYGVVLDPEMTRYLMAQNALPHLNGLIAALECNHCGQSHFDRLESAVTAHVVHKCEFCEAEFTASDNRSCVSNPLVKVIESLK